MKKQKTFNVPMPTDPKRALVLKNFSDKGRKIKGVFEKHKTMLGECTVAMVYVSERASKNPRKWLPIYSIAKIYR